MNIIDTHAHLDHLDNLEDCMSAAAGSGVLDIVAVGVDLASNKKNLEIQKNFSNPKIHVALGIHPGNINPLEIEETLSFIRENIHSAIAVGETGLDYWYKWVKKDEAKKQEQRDVFSRQLSLAKEFDLPVIIHSRGAWSDCLRMATEMGIKRGVFHWYSGPLDVLDKILEAGFYVGTTPALGSSPQLREAIAHAPIERVLIETDCPVFFQNDEGGFKSQPKDVRRTLGAYASLKNIEAEQALAVFNQNAKALFGL